MPTYATSPLAIPVPLPYHTIPYPTSAIPMQSQCRSNRTDVDVDAIHVLTELTTSCALTANTNRFAISSIICSSHPSLYA
ncbi:unnamed protein product [Oppiella nova]|uniref:Uncharacterized protein n=1 Tax=Oppiella nova TaxID=334625 RepID=A0A7R9L8R0_9ACAR|nr:unnamed protein product [Oppiella nova]CAG2159648.1 unnamed protein product [Oppiella nova]